MSSSVVEIRIALAQGVSVSDDALVVDLADGRTISVPLAWYPRLAHGTVAERSNWRFIARGVGIHWPDLDEDVSVEGLIAGFPSNESPSSLRKWMKSRGLLAKSGLQRPGSRVTARAKKSARSVKKPRR
jgi:hypothetical protein